MAEPQFVNLPLGLAVTPWADGVMISVLDQTTRHAQAAYLGHDGLLRLFQWLVSNGILQGTIEDPPNPSGVLSQWPGPKPS